MYVQCILKYILSFDAIPQNTLHGLLLQILFIARTQARCADHTELQLIISDFMNHMQDIVARAKVAFVRWTFLEVGVRHTAEA